MFRHTRTSLPIIFISFLISLSGCGPKVASTEQDEAEVFPVTLVDTMNVETDVMFVADINAVQFVEIRARINGYLEAILVDEGRTVEKGQLLFQINDQEYRAALQRAEANRKSAEAEYKS